MQKDRVPGEPEKKELLKGKGRFGKENYLILVLVGVLLLVVAWPVNDEKKTTQSVQSDSEQATIDLQTDLYSGLTIKGENDFESDVDSIPSYARYLEESLEKLLSTMEGVGKVRVMVTLEGTGETIVEKDQNIKKMGVRRWILPEEAEILQTLRKKRPQFFLIQLMGMPRSLSRNWHRGWLGWRYPHRVAEMR